MVIVLSQLTHNKPDNMSTTDNIDVPDVCANCGKGEEGSNSLKEGSNSLKACTACKLVKYCNRECQIAHRPQHKKACKRRAAELHDEKLFKEVKSEDCPICFQRLPTLLSGSKWYACCGKTICNGCAYAPIYDDQGNVIDEEKCLFCRTPPSNSDEEMIKRDDRRIKMNDYIAIYNRGCDYASGDRGLSQDYAKALEFWHQAGELGSARSYFNIGLYYYRNRGDKVEEDKKKTIHYYELAAMHGHVKARGNLGSLEARAGNFGRALRHYMIAVRSGCNDSVNLVRKMYRNEHATKDDYSKALRGYQSYLDEVKSDQRDEAAAFRDEYKYY